MHTRSENATNNLYAYFLQIGIIHICAYSDICIHIYVLVLSAHTREIYSIDIYAPPYFVC